MADLRRALLLAWLIASGVLLPVVAAPLLVPASVLQAAAARCRLEHPDGKPCPLCGMTRAFLSIGEGDWEEARRSNRAAVPLYFALAANELAAVAVLISGRRRP